MSLHILIYIRLLNTDNIYIQNQGESHRILWKWCYLKRIQ